MLVVSKQDNQIILNAVGAEESLIQQPLHRMFLKGSLNAEFDAKRYYWKYLNQEQVLHTLEGLLAHFKRYNVAIEIDDNCKHILDKKRKADNDFRDLVDKALKIKKPGKIGNLKNISQLLGPKFKRELKDFQLRALNHLLTIGNGANFSVPGSGKTSVALAYYHILRTKRNVNALLIIGPASCFEPWENEYLKCFGQKPDGIRIAGFSKIQRNESYLLADRFEMVLTTYHSAIRDINQIIECLKRRNYLLILDESHYIKRPQGGRIAETVLSLAKYSKYKVILTGTPMPNSLEDLWSQFAFLLEARSPLGPVDKYLQEIRVNSKESTLESVKNKITPFYFRVTKKQLSLPPIFIENVKCALSPLQQRIYESIAIQFLTQLKEEPQDKEAVREWRRARAIRLLQVASNPALLRQQCNEFSLPPMDLTGFSLKHGIEYYAKFEMPEKIAKLQYLVKDICGRGNKIIVWTSFIYNLTMLSNSLSEYSPVAIHGSVPISSDDDEEFTREQLIARFKTDDKCKVLLANPAACAESISLHDVCHHAIYLDRTFNCSHYMQSLDRIHRIGLKADQNTYYYLMFAENTIDNIVNNRLREKMENMGHVLEDDLPGTVPGYWANQLGDEEIIDQGLVEDHIKTFLKNQ
jgi:SNF2 family DNA or RNA helicase